jgi:hypothetical protein
MSDDRFHIERINKQILKLTIGNVQFVVDSEDPTRVQVNLFADGDIDIEQPERILELAEIGQEIHDFVTSLDAT